MRRRNLLALIGPALIGVVPLAGCGRGGMFDFRDHGVGFGKQRPVAQESFTDPAMVRAAEAIKAKNSVLLRDLVSAGTDVNGRGVEGVTLLDWVLRYGSLETMSTLLDLGAKPDGPGWRDRLASHELAPDAGRPKWLVAVLNAGKQLLTLLHAGANPRLETSSGDTFQPYYFGTPTEVLNDVSRVERRAVRAWLVAHGVPLDPSAR